MAVIKLRIQSNFEAAANDLKKFGATTEAEKKRIAAYTEKFKTKQFDKFIRDTGRMGAAVSAMRGPLAGARAEHAALGRKIETLLKNGIDPLSKEIREMRKNYEAAGRRAEKYTEKLEAQKKAAQFSRRALMAVGAAVAAAGAAMAANTRNIAKQGDEFAKNSRRIGLTAEALQELTFVADRQGVSAEALQKSFQILGKNVGELRHGYGALHANLSRTNPALAEQLANAESNEEAFSIAADAISRTSDEIDRAALTQAVFGRSGQEMITVLAGGSEEIAKLRAEAREYGIISNENAAISERVMDAETNLRAAFGGLRAEMAERLLPVAEDIMIWATEAVMNFDDFREKIEKIIPYLAPLAAGLAGFLVVTQVAAAIKSLAAGFLALNAAMAANPIGLIVAGAVALVTAGIAVYKNWGRISDFFTELGARLKAHLSAAAESVRTAWLVAGAGIRRAWGEVSTAVAQGFLRVAGKVAEISEGIPWIGKKMEGVQKKILAMQDGLAARQREIADSYRATVEEGQKRIDAEKKIRDATLARLDAEKEARKKNIASIEEEKKALKNSAEIRDAVSGAVKPAVPSDDAGASPDPSAGGGTSPLGTLRAQIAAMADVRASADKNEIDRIREMGKIKLDHLRTISEQAASIEGMSDAERLDAARMIAERRAEIEKEMAGQIKQINADMREKIIQDTIAFGGYITSSLSSIFGNLTAITKNELSKQIEEEEDKTAAILANESLSEEQRKKIIADSENEKVKLREAANKKIIEFEKTKKTIDIAHTIITTARAAMDAFAALAGIPFVGIPLAIAAAAAVTAAGAAQVALIQSTPIPTAETGGRFVVPDGPGRSDGVGLRVSPGETVDISPSGAADRMMQINLYLDGDVLASYTQEMIDSGRLDFRLANVG